VRTRLPLQLYFVADPRAIEEILVKKADAFRKDRVARLLSRVVGNGLLVNEGESRDVHAHMRGVTLNIVAQALSGPDVSPADGRAAYASGQFMEGFGRILG